MRKVTGYWRAVIIITGLITFVLIAGFYPWICDLFTDNVYGYIADGIARITGPVPVTIGEILMYVGILLTLLAMVLLLLLLFFHGKDGFRKGSVIYLKFYLLLFLLVALFYLATWYIPYRGTLLGEGDKVRRTAFARSDIYFLLEYIVAGGNEAAEEIIIKEDGSVDFPTAEEYQILIEEAMTGLAVEYPRLEGYYPPVKDAYCSDILERMGIGGYNYPLTMEPTHNRYISPLYRPLLDAHELAHHHGYYKENEANFVSMLALSRSEDPFLRLSAFVEMYYYVLEDYYSSSIPEAERDDFEWGNEPEFSMRVDHIRSVARQEELKIYEQDPPPIDNSPTLDATIRAAGDEGWSVQGEIAGDYSYDGVVLLLLQYYDGILY